MYHLFYWPGFFNVSWPYAKIYFDCWVSLRCRSACAHAAGVLGRHSRQFYSMHLGSWQSFLLNMQSCRTIRTTIMGHFRFCAFLISTQILLKMKSQQFAMFPFLSFQASLGNCCRLSVAWGSCQGLPKGHLWGLQAKLRKACGGVA